MRPEMTCAECRELMPRYRSGQLPHAERDAAARHVAACEECRRELAFWSAVDDALAASDATQSLPVNQARVWDNVRAALVRERGELTHQGLERGSRMSTQTPTTPTPSPSRITNSPAAPSRRRPIAGLVAFALIVVLSVALFGVVAPRLRHGTSLTGHGPQATATPAACPPSQLSASLPANASLNAIAMVSADDGWAVGHVWDPGHSSIAPRTLMLHLVGCRWEPAGPSISDAGLTDIMMTSASDGWAVGMSLTPSGGTADAPLTTWGPDRAIALHYVGGRWVEATNVVATAGGATPASVRLANGWMLVFNGKTHPTPYTVAYSYSLLRAVGDAWEQVPMPFVRPTMSFNDLAAAAPDDVWIAGNDDAVPDSTGMPESIIAHYEDGRWSTWSGTLDGKPIGQVNALAAASPSSVWVFGSQPYRDAHSQGSSLAAFHYDGSAWLPIPTHNPALAGLGYTATALPDGEVYILETSDLKGSFAVQRCNLDGCEVAPPVAAGVMNIRQLALFSPTQGFAVGDMLISDNPNPQAVLLAFDNGKWSVIPSAG